MATKIEVPTLGESISEAIIGKWFKAVGDSVALDEPLVELETDKITLEVNAPAAGALTEIAASEGDTVEVGALLGLIDGAGAAAKPAAPKQKPAAVKTPAKTPPKAPAAAVARNILVPTLGESITEAIVGKWFKAVGDAVATDEALAELETDKVTIEVFAQSSGALAQIVAAEGETVEVGGVIGVIDESATGAVAEAPAETETPPEQAAPAEPARPMPPSVRRLVDEHGLDASAIPATGKGGRLTKGDVLRALEDKPAEAPAPSPPEQPAAKAPVSERPISEREERVRMSPLRRIIAKRLKEAQNTAAILTTFNEADMSKLIATRAQYKEIFEKKHGVRLGFMSFFVKACVTALKEVPSVNGEVDGDDIIYKNHYDIGVAVSAPQGLVVPVVRDADHMSFAQIEQAISDYGRRAREGSLALDDLMGGTFTISNGGVFGSLMSTPILNPPQSAILGMHKIQKRPVAIGDAVEVRPMMYLAMSYDHRIIDGREAVTFLVRVKECLEDPSRLLLDL